MKQLFKIQAALKKKNNANLLSSIEKDKSKYNSLKQEYNNLKKKKNFKTINKQFIVYLFLNAITHKDIDFAFTLIKYHHIEEIETKGAKIALARFYSATNNYKKTIEYLLPIHENDKSLDFLDLHSLLISLIEMAMFKDAESILKYAIEKYPEIRVWKYEALKYQIMTNHIYKRNKQDIINNLNYMSKLTKEPVEYMYMGYCFYNAGYYQQAFNMYDKYFTIIDTKVKVDKVKHIFNSQNTLDSMNEIIDLLDNDGIQSFPVFGSLLGLVRDGKFFDHDKDADIGLFVNNYDEVYKIVSMLCKHDRFIAPTIVKNTKKNAMWNVAILNISRNTAVDLFFFHKKDNHIEAGVNTSCGTIKWIFKPFELVKKELANKIYLVPSNYESHLEETYGNWRETVVVWESLLNCPNLSKDSQIGVIYYTLQKLTKAIESRSLKKFDNLYNTLLSRWNYNFSEAATKNLEKVRKEIYIYEQKEKIDD